jgi:ABC-type multidrug transport system ATPase subunit
MKDYSVEVDNICKGYSDRNILENVSFKVSKGSIHGFLGPNGAGKSTTIKIISGLLSSDSGSIKVSGQNIMDDMSFKRKIGVLPENPPLFYDMTVNDYLLFVLDLYDLDNKTRRLKKVLDQVGIFEVSSRLIGNLSKGYKQKVGIAQALITNPEILIFDEPTVGLDPHAVIEIRELITELKKLVDSNFITRFTQVNGTHYRIYPEEDVESDQISRIIFESGMNIKHFENKTMDLEEVFVHATKEEKVQHAKTIDS